MLRMWSYPCLHACPRLTMRISCVALALNTENELAPDPVHRAPIRAFGKVGFGPFVCLYQLFEFSTYN